MTIAEPEIQHHPRTVLQVVPQLVTGGVERGTIETAAALKTAGWNAIVASAGGPMVKELRAIGVTHVALPLASKHPLTIYDNIDRLADVIYEHNVDILHARSRAPAWSGYYAAKQTERHFVTTFHNAYGAETWLKRKYNSVMAKGETIIAISDFVAAYTEKTYGIPHEKIRIIHRGVDSQRFDRKKIEEARIQKLRETWNIPTGKTVVMLPGRLTEWKGQRFFIEAIAKLKRDDLYCLIIGSGNANYKRELDVDILRYRLDETVHLVGECDDMPAALCLADVVVSTSTRPEGFGRVIAEAMAMGCAVIATKHGGAEEIVLNGKTGWLISPGNAQTLSTALEKVLSMPKDVREKVGKQAMSHIRTHFTTKLMTDRTLAVYEELLKTK